MLADNLALGLIPPLGNNRKILMVARIRWEIRLTFSA